MSELGMAGMGLDMAQAGLSFAGNMANRKQNRAIRRLGDENRQNAYNYQQGELDREQQDVNRGAYKAEQSNLGNAERRGVLHSSIPMANAENIDQDRLRRYNQIQRRQDFDTSNFNNETQMIYHQRKSQDITNTINMLNGLLGGGANGGAQALSSRTY